MRTGNIHACDYFVVNILYILRTKERVRKRVYPNQECSSWLRKLSHQSSCAHSSSSSGRKQFWCSWSCAVENSCETFVSSGCFLVFVDLKWTVHSVVLSTVQNFENCNLAVASNRMLYSLWNYFISLWFLFHYRT